jgi:hypothetical protein
MFRFMLSILGVLAMAGTLNAQVDAQVKRLEHFQCYPVFGDQTGDQALEPIPATLTDQFEEKAQVRVWQALRFCNPTRKLHRDSAFGVDDPNQHLTIYATHPRIGPQRVVSIRNQFGPQKLLVREPVAIAVPTQKFAPPDQNFPGSDFPKELDHFRCYAARGKDVKEKVGLSDQFILPVRAHRVFGPVLFCNPVEKTTADGNVTPIVNPKAHLTCYAMTRVDFQGSVGVQNQFETNIYHVFAPDILCVPTVKRGFKVLKDTLTGGRP